MPARSSRSAAATTPAAPSAASLRLAVRRYPRPAHAAILQPRHKARPRLRSAIVTNDPPLPVLSIEFVYRDVVHRDDIALQAANVGDLGHPPPAVMLTLDMHNQIDRPD